VGAVFCLLLHNRVEPAVVVKVVKVEVEHKREKFQAKHSLISISVVV
jgi:hypothetical protein